MNLDPLEQIPDITEESGKGDVKRAVMFLLQDYKNRNKIVTAEVEPKPIETSPRPSWSESHSEVLPEVGTVQPHVNSDGTVNELIEKVFDGRGWQTRVKDYIKPTNVEQ